MKQLLFLLWGMGSFLYSQGQVVTVQDQQSNKAVELVVFMSEVPKAFATTGKDGKADLSAFNDAARIEIRRLDYKTMVLSFEEIKARGFKLSLEPSGLELEKVVVSATKWRQNSTEVPYTIARIPKEEVELQNPQTAADLLGVSGKVFIQKSQQGGGSPMIRGFATNRLLYSVDGVRMNTAIFRGGNIQNVINLDPFATENTEVLFGPNSVIYGSDAIGGVMSFQTLELKYRAAEDLIYLQGNPILVAKDDPLISGSAVTRYSSANNERTIHGDIGLSGKKWASATSFSYWNYGDLMQGSNGPDDYLKPYHVERQGDSDVVVQNNELLQVPSAYSQLNFMQKVGFRPSEKWAFEYAFHYSETSEYGRYDRHNRTRNGLPRYGEWKYGPQSWMMNFLSAENFSSNAFYDRMSVKLAWQSFRESRISRNFNSINREIREEEVEAYSVNLDLLKELNEQVTLFYGAEYVLNDVFSNGTNENIESSTSQDGPSRYPRSQWSSVAAYMSAENKLSKKVVLSGGLRYNQYTLNANFDTTFYPFPFSDARINNGSLTGSAGIVYRPTNKWVLSTNLSTAFRSPNVDDMGKVFDSEPGAVVVPNPALEAEYAYNIDFSVARSFGSVMKLYLTSYYTLLENAMVRRDDQLNGLDSIVYEGQMSKVQSIQNAAQASVYGVQIGMEIKLPWFLSFESDLNFQEGREETDDGTIGPSRHAAPFFGVARLNYKKGKWLMQLNTQFQGERPFNELAIEERSKDEIYAKDSEGRNFSPSWYTLNFKAMYRLGEAWTLNAGVENIMDLRYRPYSSGISGAGRNFICSVRFDF